MEKKLQVKNLTISFKTGEGKVQAVRDISFDLHAGETLAIVGESGSGKSVTSKAILGILAGNAMVEGGEIIYDGQDLLRITEEDFHKIRGDKIAMIFQDPMSSLNPIAKIGKQLTEAMLLKGRARQKQSRDAFNSYLARLNARMLQAVPDADSTTKCKNFDKFEYKHLDLEGAYNTAKEAATEAADEADSLAFELDKNAVRDVNYRLRRICVLSKQAVHPYVVSTREEELKTIVAVLPDELKIGKETKNFSGIVEKLKSLVCILREATAFDMPNFFAMGYYETFSGKLLPEGLSVAELNVFLRKYLDDNFMLDFISDTKRALIFSAERTKEHRRLAVESLSKNRMLFEEDVWKKDRIMPYLDELDAIIRHTIDPLAIHKDSRIYTFMPALRDAVKRYFTGEKSNRKEQKRYDRQMEKQNAVISKGGTPSFVVVAPSLVDFDVVKADARRQIDELIAHYRRADEAFANRNFDDEAVAVIDYLKACASGIVQRVTKHMAKDRAIKLMEEVGISEPRRRYNQYPFEFSGGMRQRIVIAIALAANPDILICDEPTTALDVTIQSQILELINKLKEERHLSVIFITHDLGVVANMADRIAVMYAGKIVEYGTSEDVFYRAAHPYTWALLSSMPDLDTDEKLDAIPGTPPNMIYPPVGDAFAERNKYALKIDFEKQPPMFKISDTHYAATWLLHPDAPKVEMPKIITDRIARMEQKRKEQSGT